MRLKRWAVGLAALVGTACLGTLATAEDHPYSEGEVVNVARIRTVDGHFGDYMKWLSTDWKRLQEIAKKAGYITGYEVLTVEPRTADDPDVLLVVRYKNWAALDDSLAKGDEVLKQFGQSNAQADKAQSDRASIRKVLGSTTMRVLTLK